MAVDAYKGYPNICLEDSYVPKVGENLRKGMAVKRDPTTGFIIKATGAVDEYAMICMTDQSDRFVQEGGMVQVVKENATLRTTYYKTGVGYTYHGKLQVSVTPGEEGTITIHAGGTAPVLGRFVKMDTIDGLPALVFDLVRA